MKKIAAALFLVLALLAAPGSAVTFTDNRIELEPDEAKACAVHGCLVLTKRALQAALTEAGKAGYDAGVADGFEFGLEAATKRRTSL